jgi:hypothetical protein
MMGCYKGHLACVYRQQADPLDWQLMVTSSQSMVRYSGQSGTRTGVPDWRQSSRSCRHLAMELLEQAHMEHIVQVSSRQ